MDIDDFVETYAVAGDEWPRRGFWLVVHDDADDINPLDMAKAFKTQKLALEYARMCANGNMDWRVLHVGHHQLVKARDS
jgi:hypothetical protein